MEKQERHGDIRLWTACAQLKSAVGYKTDGYKTVYILMDDDALNELANTYPYQYLGKLELWHEALKNQIYYAIDTNHAYLACTVEKDGEIKVIYFRLFIGQYALYLDVFPSESLKDVYDQSVRLEWKNAKSEDRKRRKQ